MVVSDSAKGVIVLKAPFKKQGKDGWAREEDEEEEEGQGRQCKKTRQISEGRMS